MTGCAETNGSLPQVTCWLTAWRSGSAQLQCCRTHVNHETTFTFFCLAEVYAQSNGATSAKEVMLFVWSVCLSDCLSVCLSVSRITEKVMSRFHWNFMLWLRLPIGRTDQLLVVIGPKYGFWIDFPLPSLLWNEGILRDLLAFLIQSPADFHNTWQNDWCRLCNESTTFWEYPANIQIQIWISPQIRIWMPDHFWLRLTPWRRFGLYLSII